jgi:Glycosyl transferase family 2
VRRCGGAVPGSVSVVMVLHNEAGTVGRRLREFADRITDEGLAGEVVVVSDGSTDDTAAVARRFAACSGEVPVTVIELSENVGKAAALTAGCRMARHEVIAMADARQTWAPDALRRLLENFADPEVEAVDRLAGDHGLLGRHRDTGAPGYAFVHGNWALDNARPDGRWCGVNDEIRILRETGCYADFTYPSAPSPTQPPTVNALYYATGDACRPRGHDRGVAVGAGAAPRDALMLVQGPLGLDWSRRKWGCLPRLENACVQATQPATAGRLGLWLKARVQVAARPDWYFVKLHAHGGPERDRPALIGPAAVAFHRGLARLAAERPGFFVHYVTAREMVNLARAAEFGWTGTVESARDFEYIREPVADAARAVPATSAATPT